MVQSVKRDTLTEYDIGTQMLSQESFGSYCTNRRIGSYFRWELLFLSRDFF